MTPAGLLTRRISPADALSYYALRARSLEGLAYAIEPQILDELNTGSGGMADLLLRYSLEGTRVWGVFDQHTLTGVLCLSRRLAFELPDAALLWGVQVLPRYRGTIVSRLLMESAVRWCEQELRVHWITTYIARDNVPARQYLERFGFERVAKVGDGFKEGEVLICMRRRV